MAHNLFGLAKAFQPDASDPEPLAMGSGGAVGVGRATTATVVKSIVAIIGMDAVFTAVFYAFEL